MAVAARRLLPTIRNSRPVRLEVPLLNGSQYAPRLDVSPAPSPPVFLVTIDTEGDNLWTRPRTVTTRNAEWLPRFQALCEAHGLRPTYLTDYDMAVSPAFRDFARDLLVRDAGEIGMHLHAWN